MPKPEQDGRSEDDPSGRFLMPPLHSLSSLPKRPRTGASAPWFHLSLEPRAFSLGFDASRLVLGSRHTISKTMAQSLKVAVSPSMTSLGYAISVVSPGTEREWR